MPAPVLASGEGEGEADEVGEAAGAGDGGEGEGEGEALPPGDPPVAVAQVPATAALGDRVGLSGAQSVGRDLRYTWTVMAPDGSEAPTEADPELPSAATFTALLRGEYQVSLRVADDVHRTDLGQAHPVEVGGFEALERSIDAVDIATAPDGEAAWIATSSGASRARLVPAPEDDPTAERLWQWTDYDGGGQGSDAATLGSAFVWLARTGSGSLRVKRSHADDDNRPATPQALPGVGRLRAMAVGPEGRIWFGGDDGMRRTLVRGGGAPSFPLDLPGERSILALHAADAGLWVGRSTGACLAPWTDESQLACTREISVLDGVAHLITALTVDGAGDLWIATDGQGLYRVPAQHDPDAADGPAIEVIAPGARGLPAGAVDDLAAMPDGDVWLVAGDVLLRIYTSPTGPPRVERFDTGAGLTILGPVRAVAVATGDDADVWVAGERGIARLDR